MVEAIAVIISLGAIAGVAWHFISAKIRKVMKEKEQTRRFMEDEMFMRYNEFEAYCAMLRKAALSNDFNSENKK